MLGRLRSVTRCRLGFGCVGTKAASCISRCPWRDSFRSRPQKDPKIRECEADVSSLSHVMASIIFCCLRGEISMKQLPPGMDAGAMELPAVFVNHIQVSQISDSLIRLAFAEAPAPNVPTYRSVVVLAAPDAILLVNLLQRMLNVAGTPAAPGSRPN